MIVFDLRCGADHVFEAWFASSAAFEEQCGRALVACPICGATDVTKAVMAPNVAAKGNRAVPAPLPAPAPTAAPAPSPVPDRKALLAALAAAQKRALRDSTWVGGDFARQARAMHAGEQDRAAIHGQASVAEVAALVDDGVPVAPLPLPVVPPDRVN